LAETPLIVTACEHQNPKSSFFAALTLMGPEKTFLLGEDGLSALNFAKLLNG
jgi:hypothetical protein